MKLITTAGKRLKDIREIRGLTLAELSKLCKIPAQTLNRYELEQRIPKLDNIIKISEALNINPLWLQGYDVLLGGETVEEKPATTSDDGLTEDEKEILKMYRMLPPEYQEVSLIQLKALLDKNKK